MGWDNSRLQEVAFPSYFTSVVCMNMCLSSYCDFEFAFEKKLKSQHMQNEWKWKADYFSLRSCLAVKMVWRIFFGVFVLSVFLRCCSSVMLIKSVDSQRVRNVSDGLNISIDMQDYFTLFCSYIFYHGKSPCQEKCKVISTGVLVKCTICDLAVNNKRTDPPTLRNSQHKTGICCQSKLKFRWEKKNCWLFIYSWNKYKHEYVSN